MKNILIVVDVQKGFCRYEQTHKVAEKIASLTQSGLFDNVIATKFYNREGSLYTRLLNWHRLQNRPDTDLFKGVKADKIIKKYVYSCVDNRFLKLLKTLNDGRCPPFVFIAGIDTDCCVLKIAADLFEADVVPLVLTSYCHSNGGDESRAAGESVMRRLIGSRCLIGEEIEKKETLDDLIADIRADIR